MAVRSASMRLREPLSAEDCQVQSMPDASPVKWHLAHTTWFYEQFILDRLPGYKPHHPQFSFLFNSYYNAVGQRNERPRRGHITRPSLEEVELYRHTIDAAMLDLLADDNPPVPRDELQALLEIGLNHEQQHQELLLTDLKHLLSCNPLRPAYIPAPTPQSGRGASLPPPPPLEWLTFPEGIYSVGHGGDGFAYDNESPRHRTFLESFHLASRPVTCGEFIEFIRAGGYSDPRFWLDQGWATVQREQWHAPMYWEQCPPGSDSWQCFTLAGPRPVNPAEPVCHVSYFEADAFARWAGARLPRESEWEAACARLPVEGNFADSGAFHPQPADGAGSRSIRQAFGDVWEWTASPYTAYPGYRPPGGALGEYNGKFMCDQWVLRGGSCATPASHMRPTYRNFFPAAARWQFSGFRLARDA
jgi:ergothioneine biosynthesis protein EgtB